MTAKPKIMVVDDDPGMRLTLEGIIEDEGFEVVGSEDGFRAIELAKATHLDLIFMDIKMPGINGVETYREIKRTSPGTVVVMMTGFSVDGLIQDALEEGAFAILYKPFRLEEIIEVVDQVLKTNLVLLVDDMPADRRVMKSILEDNGYMVSEARNGEEAVAMATQRHFGLILMHVKMPGIHGIETLEGIRRLDPQVKAIFIGGCKLEPPVLECLSASAYTTIVKPAGPDELLELIRSITRMPTAL